MIVRRLRYAIPQWRNELTSAVLRAKQRLAHARIDGIEWYWPADDDVARHRPNETVRLLTPFDPIVWDRRRFRLFWNWEYRFEAYTPAPKRKLGYYAMPLLWRDRVVGWGNLCVVEGQLHSRFGYVAGGEPKEPAFASGLEAELTAMRRFLNL